MNKSDWKCPACGYVNLALDESCEACGHTLGEAVIPAPNPRAKRPTRWKGRLLGCLFLLAFVGGGTVWLYGTLDGRSYLTGRVFDLERGAQMRQEEAELKAALSGPEGKAIRKQIAESGKEIERLLGVLGSTEDPEVSNEALSQLTVALEEFSTSYPAVHGYHCEMPKVATKAADYCIGRVLEAPESELALPFLQCMITTVLKWRLDDFRNYEPQLLQILSTGGNATPHEPYTGSDIEMMKQWDMEEERRKQALQSVENLHQKACDLLEFGLYSERFAPHLLVHDNESEASYVLDFDHAKVLLPKVTQAAEESQSAPGMRLATEIESLLHEQEIKNTVAGG